MRAVQEHRSCDVVAQRPPAALGIRTYESQPWMQPASRSAQRGTMCLPMHACMPVAPARLLLQQGDPEEDADPYGVRSTYEGAGSHCQRN